MSDDHMPSIEWNKIPITWTVEEMRHYFIAVAPDGKRHLVTWDSQNARFAQTTLKKKAHVCTCPRPPGNRCLF